MIPSDHFVRFYNEVFKFLDERNGLEPYYEAVSRKVDIGYQPLLKAKGLRGVYEYYLRIRKEENCDMDLILNDHEVILNMHVCPSLSKAINNDAGPCLKYCLHCPGWTLGVYQRAGLYQVYDIMGLTNPQCCEWIYDDIELARKKYEELKKTRPAEMLRKNFD